MWRLGRLCSANRWINWVPPNRLRKLKTFGSGSSPTVTQLQVPVHYTSPVVSAQTTLLATGYLSFDGSDSSNPVAAGQVRVK